MQNNKMLVQKIAESIGFTLHNEEMMVWMDPSYIFGLCHEIWAGVPPLYPDFIDITPQFFTDAKSNDPYKKDQKYEIFQFKNAYYSISILKSLYDSIMKLGASKCMIQTTEHEGPLICTFTIEGHKIYGVLAPREVTEIKDGVVVPSIPEDDDCYHPISCSGQNLGEY